MTTKQATPTHLSMGANLIVSKPLTMCVSIIPGAKHTPQLAAYRSDNGFFLDVDRRESREIQDPHCGKYPGSTSCECLAPGTKTITSRDGTNLNNSQLGETKMFEIKNPSLRDLQLAVYKTIALPTNLIDPIAQWILDTCKAGCFDECKQCTVSLTSNRLSFMHYTATKIKACQRLTHPCNDHVISFGSAYDHKGDLEEFSTGGELEEFCPLQISQLTKVLQRYETIAKQAIKNNAEAGDTNE